MNCPQFICVNCISHVMRGRMYYLMHLVALEKELIISLSRYEAKQCVYLSMKYKMSTMQIPLFFLKRYNGYFLN